MPARRNMLCLEVNLTELVLSMQTIQKPEARSYSTSIPLPPPVLPDRRSQSPQA